MDICFHFSRVSTQEQHFCVIWQLRISLFEDPPNYFPQPMYHSTVPLACMTLPVCPYPCQHLLLSVLTIIAILVGVSYVDLFKRERTRAAPSDLPGMKTTPALLMVQLPVVSAVSQLLQKKRKLGTCAPLLPEYLPWCSMRSPPSHARSPLSHAVGVPVSGLWT